MVHDAETPRPDFIRSPWMSLEPLWDFNFDDDNIGLNEKWFLNGLPEPVKIRVPYPFQSKLSGIGDGSIHNVVWYSKTFKLSEDFRQTKVLLKFGAMDYKTTVWLNGKNLGEHVGGFSPFSFDITDHVDHENILVLRVEDCHGDQARGKQDPRLKPSGCTYMRVTGIWQPVWIESCGSAWIDRFQIFPDVEHNGFQLYTYVNGQLNNLKLRLRVLLAESELINLTQEVKENPLRISLELQEVCLWSPEEPDLYAIELMIEKNDIVLDKVRGYFGLRKIDVANGKITLNNKPIYLKFALDQGFFPDGLYVAPNIDALKRDVEAVKKLGLNGVRKHQKPEDPRYLYWCDKLGVLVWEEMPDWGMSLEYKNLDNFWGEVESVILRDFNHPSIVAWVPFNERETVRNNLEHRRFIEEVCLRIKRLDPTRLLVDNSGYSHVGPTDIIDIHDYSGWRGRKYFKEVLLKRVQSLKTGEPREFRIAIEDFKYDNQPIVLSEWGGWGIKGFRPVVDREIMVYGPPVTDEYEFLTRYRENVRAIRECEFLAGFCYTQLYDVEGELNGYMTYDRRWKVDPEQIAKIHNAIDF
ncbi:glycoside hydrolase family 2 [Candidatus Bathyarchaeota archaeon]|nr:glycoside hydrolase family 2 [Candidatus Bathyarchaeota archaeon]